ncbi:POLR3GL [Bugula neritina]|uniref:POLR3GL n=1 Tax=Bugula neritina TaxID=10212 RepID=A0A7J7IZW7_BUGNE|nr:POLR3GL [Bugula neritina]
MGGRGRGRGRGGSIPMSIDALGFGRKAELPEATFQPPPTFPKLETQPLPLEQSEKYNYLVDLKRYFKTFMEDSPYYVKQVEAKKDIARYSDKYKAAGASSSVEGVILYSRLPDELKPGSGKLKKKKKADMSKLAIQNTMQALEKEENSKHKADSGDEAAKSDAEKSDDDAEQEVEEELDEEEMEEVCITLLQLNSCVHIQWRMIISMNILTMERHLEMMMVMVTTAPCTERENEVRDDIIWPQFLVHSPLMVRGALQSSCRECNVC